MTAAPRRLVHLSDLHLTGSGVDEDGVDAVRSLDLVLDALQYVEDVTDVVVTGDVADDGSPAGCRRAWDAVGSWALARGARLVVTTGNHDRRDAFGAVFGSGHLAAADDATDDVEGALDFGVAGPAGTCAAVSTVAGLRIVSLDSLVEGRTEGRLGADQLRWLGVVLAEPAPAGTVVALHHPPVASPAIRWQASCCRNRSNCRRYCAAPTSSPCSPATCTTSCPALSRTCRCG